MFFIINSLCDYSLIFTLPLATNVKYTIESMVYIAFNIRHRSRIESIYFIKNISIMKNLTDFRKMVETDVDPRLQIW